MATSSRIASRVSARGSCAAMPTITVTVTRAQETAKRSAHSSRRLQIDIACVSRAGMPPRTDAQELGEGRVLKRRRRPRRGLEAALHRRNHTIRHGCSHEERIGPSSASAPGGWFPYRFRTRQGWMRRRRAATRRAAIARMCPGGALYFRSRLSCRRCFCRRVTRVRTQRLDAWDRNRNRSEARRWRSQTSGSGLEVRGSLRRVLSLWMAARRNPGGCWGSRLSACDGLLRLRR